jgi:hypothetical protein
MKEYIEAPNSVKAWGYPQATARLKPPPPVAANQQQARRRAMEGAASAAP